MPISSLLDAHLRRHCQILSCNIRKTEAYQNSNHSSLWASIRTGWQGEGAGLRSTNHSACSSPVANHRECLGEIMHSNHAACTAKPHYHWSFVLQLPISSNLSTGSLYMAHFQKINSFWRVTESSQTFRATFEKWHLVFIYRHRSIWIWDTWLWILLGVWIINTV